MASNYLLGKDEIQPTEVKELSLQKAEQGHLHHHIVDQPIKILERQYTFSLSDKEMGRAILQQLSAVFWKIKSSHLPGN